MFGDVVMEIAKTKVRCDLRCDRKKNVAMQFDVDLTTEDLKGDHRWHTRLSLRKKWAETLPQEPKDQLMEAIMAVFRSWNNDRAILYRQLNEIPDSIGTAVNVQSMVFGNMGETSGTGVAFTRSPVNR